MQDPCFVIVFSWYSIFIYRHVPNINKTMNLRLMILHLKSDNHSVRKQHVFNCKKICEAKRNIKQASNFRLDFNRKDLADKLVFDKNLKSNPIAMIQTFNQK